MAVREFKLINENDEEYSLMDIKKYCLLTNVNGLGLEYSNEYVQLSNIFIQSSKKISQKPITGTLNFINYDNFRTFVDFIESSENLKFVYKIPYSDGTSEKYLKDVQVQSLTKSEKQTNGILSEDISFDCLGLWYKEEETIYDMSEENGELRWDFSWDGYFMDYGERILMYENNSSAEAPVKIEIDGEAINPKIDLYVNDELYQSLEFPLTIESGEKLLYSSKINDFYIQKENSDGTTEDLFDLDYIDFENDNVIRIPAHSTCVITLSAENEVANAQITIYPYYAAV